MIFSTDLDGLGHYLMVHLSPAHQLHYIGLYNVIVIGDELDFMPFPSNLEDIDSFMGGWSLGLRFLDKLANMLDSSELKHFHLFIAIYWRLDSDHNVCTILQNILPSYIQAHTPYLNQRGILTVSVKVEAHYLPNFDDYLEERCVQDLSSLEK